MAIDVAQQTAQIRSAVLGEQVRESIAGAIDRIASETNAVVQRYENAANSIEAAEQRADAAGRLAATAQQNINQFNNLNATVTTKAPGTSPKVDLVRTASGTEFQFSLPVLEHELSAVPIKKLPGEDPTVSYDTSTGAFSFGIPSTPELDARIEALPPGANPEGSFAIETGVSDGQITQKGVFTFKIPGIPAIAAKAIPVAESANPTAKYTIETDENTGNKVCTFTFGIPKAAGVESMETQLDTRPQLVLIWESETNFDDPVVQYGEQVILTDEGKLDAYDAVLVEFQTLLNNYYAKSKKVTTARPVRDLVYALVYPDTSTMAYYYKQKADVAPSAATSLSRRVRMIRNADLTVAGTVHHRGVYFGDAWVGGVTGTAAATSIGYKYNAKAGLPANCCMIPKRIFGITNITKLSADGTIIGIDEEVSG